MHQRRTRISVIASAAAAAALTLTACGGHNAAGTASTGTASTGTGHTAAVAAGGFGWFHSGPAPAGWRQASPAGRDAVLSYPASLATLAGDRGTVTVGLNSAAGAVLVYLNVTPRQGGETLRSWPAFRLAHLREDGDSAVRLDAASATLPFRGGQGRCVLDDYTTKVHNNHYREIACFVRGARGASVLVAATRAVTWGHYGALLERVVNGFTVS